MSVTLGSLGAGESLVGTPASTTLATKSVVAGNEVYFDSDADTVTVNAGVQPVCILSYAGTVYTIPNTSSQSIAWDTVDYDPLSMQDAMNPERIVIPEDGFYTITACFGWKPLNDNTARLYHNFIQLVKFAGGSETICRTSNQAYGSTTSAIPILVTRTRKLFTGDYFYIQLTNGSGTTTDTVTLPTTNVVSVYKLLVEE